MSRMMSHCRRLKGPRTLPDELDARGSGAPRSANVDERSPRPWAWCTHGCAYMPPAESAQSVCGVIDSRYAKANR